jgi:alpha-tubulin suppressor-like RCC1 family protein
MVVERSNGFILYGYCDGTLPTTTKPKEVQNTCTSVSNIAGTGYNAYYFLGDGTNVDKTVPTSVNLANLGSDNVIVDIQGGVVSSIMRTSTEKLYTWGDNTNALGTGNSGPLGVGDFLFRNKPTAVVSSGALLGRVVTKMLCAGHCV